MSGSTLIDLDDVIDISLDAYLPYLKGASPSMLSHKLSMCIGSLPTPMATRFVNACLLAASTQRKPVTDFVNLSENAALSDWVKKNWCINGKLNYTAFNMIGHCLLAASASGKNNYVQGFREKMNGAQSIWDCDLEKSNLSDVQVEIFTEKKKRIKKEEAVKHGTDIYNMIKGRLSSGGS